MLHGVIDNASLVINKQNESCPGHEIQRVLMPESKYKTDTVLFCCLFLHSAIIQEEHPLFRFYCNGKSKSSSAQTLRYESVFTVLTAISFVPAVLLKTDATSISG